MVVVQEGRRLQLEDVIQNVVAVLLWRQAEGVSEAAVEAVSKGHETGCEEQDGVAGGVLALEAGQRDGAEAGFLAQKLLDGLGDES